MTKVKSREEISEIASSLRKKGNVIVTTCGAFDIMHVGHLESLQHARNLGDVLIVCLNSDSSIKQYKSDKRPIIPEKQRAEMLSALECVDYVTIFNETTPNNILEAIRPSIHVKSKTGYKGIEKDVVEKNNGKIVLLDDVPGLSTSKIIEKIIEAYK